MESGCLLWASSLNHKGYGLFRNDEQRQVPVHQWVYDQFIGGRTDEHVLHTCDVRNCVEKTHLFLGSNQDNIDDKVAKGRQYRPKGAAHHMTHLSDDDVRHIRSAPDIVSGVMLAELYGVSPGTISQIKTGKRFKEVV